MPDQPSPQQQQPEERAMYARTNGDMMIGGSEGINPSDPATGPVWWFGSDTPGGGTPWRHGGTNDIFGPQHGSAAALPVVTRATALITGPLTSAAFRQIDLTTGTPLGRARWMTDPMLLRPDQRFVSNVYPDVVELPRSTFWASWIRNAIWWGMGAFLTQLDEAGSPLAGSLRNLDPRLLSTERDASGALHWVLNSDGAEDERAIFDRNGELSFGAITYRLATVDAYARGQFRSGVPNGVLQVSSPGLTQEQADELKASWMRAHGNDRRSIAVLNAATSFQAMNLNPTDAGLDAVKRLNIGDAAMAFGLDPLTLGVSLGNSATYNNLRDAWNNHRDFGLAPWIAAVQDTLSALLPGSQGAVIDLDRFVNPTAKERYDGYEVALRAGILDVDEVRALEGLQPRPVSTGSPEEERNLSAAEVSQKVYLAVGAGILSVEEARQMIADAGGKLDPAAVPTPSALEVTEPTGTEGVRSIRSPAWRR
jgi:hypothetical protein